jgi:hypothetical protein
VNILAIFIAAPVLALVPALMFGVVHWRRPRRALLVAAIAWAVYFLYEEGMRRRILCTGECNIRVDLLLVYPLLLAFSLAAVVRAIRSR